MTTLANQRRLCSYPTINPLVVKLGFIMFLFTDSIEKFKSNFTEKEIYWRDFANV